MIAFLIIVFVLVPLAELAVIIKVGEAIGALNTIGLLLLISVVGALLVKHEGLGVIRRMRAQLDAGQVPGVELVNGALLLLAGALLLVPGFITDALGLLLLLPPVRSGVRVLARRRLSRRVRAVRVWTAPGPGRGPGPSPPRGPGAGPSLPPG